MCTSHTQPGHPSSNAPAFVSQRNLTGPCQNIRNTELVPCRIRHSLFRMESSAHYTMISCNNCRFILGRKLLHRANECGMCVLSANMLLCTTRRLCVNLSELTMTICLRLFIVVTLNARTGQGTNMQQGRRTEPNIATKLSGQINVFILLHKKQSAGC